MAFDKDKILVVVPTYNEVESVPRLLDKIFSLPCAPSVLVVDDNSGDGTSQKVRVFQKRYPRLFLLTRPKKLGLGGAYRQGFEFALENRYEFVVQMDGDLTHDPAFIDGMVGALGNCDIVVASRYVRGARIAGFSLGRRCLSRMGNFLARVLLRLPVVDATSGFKAFRRTALERICVATTTSEGFVFQIETVWRAHKAGCKIKELPFSFIGRRSQRSKFSLKICWEALRKIIAWSFVGA
jgi:dolichol-phosphate mannosyltransferase